MWGVPGMLWVGAKDAAKHPVAHGTAPHKDVSRPQVSGVASLRNPLLDHVRAVLMQWFIHIVCLDIRVSAFCSRSSIFCYWALEKGGCEYQQGQTYFLINLLSEVIYDRVCVCTYAGRRGASPPHSSPHLVPVRRVSNILSFCF